jgi:hypothetical protein
MSKVDDIAWRVQEETRKLFRDFKDETTRTPTAFEKLDKSFEVPGLVPVSRVFVASQLMVARWLFETFPSVLKRQILKLVETLPTRAGAKILAKQIRPPHSPTPVPVLTVSGAAGAKAIS